MRKGIYPAVVYVLLFSIGVALSSLIYNFTTSSLSDKQAELEEVQAERICLYLEGLSKSGGEANIDIGSYGLVSNPLRVMGKTEHICEGNLSSGGSCDGRCKIRYYGGIIMVLES